MEKPLDDETLLRVAQDAAARVREVAADERALSIREQALSLGVQMAIADPESCPFEHAHLFESYLSTGSFGLNSFGEDMDRFRPEHFPKEPPPRRKRGEVTEL